MRLTVVAPQVPHRRVRHAGGAFLHDHLVELTGLGAEVTLLCLDSEAGSVERILPTNVTAMLAEPADSRFADRATDALRSRIHRDALARAEVRALLDAGLIEHAGAADVVELHWTAAATLVPLLRDRGIDTPISVVAHDVGAQAERHRIRRYGSWRARLAQPLLDPIRDRNEARDLSGADLVLVFKAADESLLRDLGVSTPVQVLWPPVPAPESIDSRIDGEVLFTGAMWRRENVEAVTWLLEEIWPRVVARVPTARLTIAGAGPPAALRRRGSAGVTFTDEVDDLGPFYERASVFVAPLVVGGGLKFKVLHAMSWALPVVATSIAAQGLVDAAPPGPLWAVADRADVLADALADALRDPERAATVGQAAQRWVTERDSFPASTARVLDRYRALADR